jgi:hypothetical protein
MLLFCHVWYLGINVAIFIEILKLLKLNKFEKLSLSVEIFMAFLLVIDKSVCICATVMLEIHAAEMQWTMGLTKIIQSLF